MTTPEQLREVAWFASLPEDRLAWLAGLAQTKTALEGELLLRQGDAASGIHLLLSGEIVILQLLGRHETIAGLRQPPCFLGEISLLTGNSMTASCRARTNCELLWWSEDTFFELLGCCRQFARGIFSTMAARTSETESISSEMEKMASLGTLAAGLAHELNNPAAAAVRSLERAEGRAAEIHDLTRAMARWSGSGKFIADFHALTSGDPPANSYDSLELADREDALADWLDAKGVPDAWNMAPALAQAAVTPDSLDELSKGAEEPDFARAMQWAGAALELRVLLADGRSACGRISDLVTAMKSYSYMDQDITQEVDIHKGIDDTLVILKHKTPAGVEILRDYSDDLPRVTVYGSELNQVWTNILDNALDVLKDGGKIRISTQSAGERVVVIIADDGPGIPKEIQGKIFDPFFTTKTVGEGTGLGLNISHRIVVSRHCGCLDVDSKPGETRFTVTLPLTPPECAEMAGKED